jgi:hypothetical protein
VRLTGQDVPSVCISAQQWSVPYRYHLLGEPLPELGPTAPHNRTVMVLHEGRHRLPLVRRLAQALVVKHTVFPQRA